MTTFASRARMVALAATAALTLAACNQTDSEAARRANKPLSPQMVSLISQKDMTPASPILVRIFKEEAELEVWKETNDGAYALLKTYPICRWSGELGPKVRMGDRQAPEGFYTITPGQMNPNSNYYLSFNLGFPNAFDRAYGRTGEFLMVHGDCSSAGCYAMTDEQISEIFSLARESFAGGQRAFQVQAYPFRMTPKNLAKHRNNPNMAFWRNLKQGSDHFEVTRHEPKVNVCNRQYVFDAQLDPSQRFDPAGPCPSYQVPESVASAVAAKRRDDDAQMAALAPSSPMAPVRTGSDGGMHPIFLAEIKRQRGEGGEVAFAPQAPGTVPETTRPPLVADEKSVADVGGPEKPAVMAPAADPAARPGAVAVAAAPAPAPAESARVASTAASPSLGNLFGLVGDKPAPPAAAMPETAPLPPTRAATPAAPKPADKPTAAAPAPKPAVAGVPQHTVVASDKTSAAGGSSLTGAAPTLGTESFTR